MNRISFLDFGADIPDNIWMMMAKFGGAISGSAVSIVYMFPASFREAAARLVVGMLTGMLFGKPTGAALAEHLGIIRDLTEVELVLTGSALASLTAWWALGAVARFLRVWKSA